MGQKDLAKARQYLVIVLLVIADVVTGKINVQDVDIPEYEFIDEEADSESDSDDDSNDTEEQED